MCSSQKSDENFLILTFLWIKTNVTYTQDLKWSLNNVVHYKYSLSPASNWFVTLYYIIASSIELILPTWPSAVSTFIILYIYGPLHA